MYLGSVRVWMNPQKRNSILIRDYTWYPGILNKALDLTPMQESVITNGKDILCYQRN